MSPDPFHSLFQSRNNLRQLMGPEFRLVLRRNGYGLRSRFLSDHIHFKFVNHDTHLSLLPSSHGDSRSLHVQVDQLTRLHKTGVLDIVELRQLLPLGPLSAQISDPLKGRPS